MKNRIILLVTILMSLVSYSEVTRARFISGGTEYQRFSTKDEKFSGDFDLIIPEIMINKDELPILTIRFIEIGKLHGFRKIKISNVEDEVIFNVESGEAKITFIGNEYAEFVDKIVNIEDIDVLLDMTRSEKQMKVDFINKYDEVITKEVNDKEKEILKWTILNYEALL